MEPFTCTTVPHFIILSDSEKGLDKCLGIKSINSHWKDSAKRCFLISHWTRRVMRGGDHKKCQDFPAEGSHKTSSTNCPCQRQSTGLSLQTCDLIQQDISYILTPKTEVTKGLSTNCPPLLVHLHNTTDTIVLQKLCPNLWTLISSW